jgi:hypothetical protein
VFLVDDDEVQRRYDGIATRTLDLRIPFREVVGILQEGNERNFASSGGFFGREWAPLADSTLERKARDGLPARPLVATGALMRAIQGGAGKTSRAGKTSASAGVGRRVFWGRFAMSGAKGANRRGEQPPRTIVGATEIQRREAIGTVNSYLLRGAPSPPLY